MTARNGFSMVEVVVAMVLLAIILTALAGFTFSTAQSQIRATDSGTREAVLLEAVNRMNALPFAMLASSCDTVGTTRNRFSRCVAISNNTGQVATVQVTVTPLQRGAPPSSALFTRHSGNAPQSPLCLTGSCP